MPAFPAAGSRQTPPDHMAQPAVETLLPCPRLYLGNLWAVCQRSVSPECISESLVLPHRNAELLLVDRQE